ncbi:DUF4129 domain-containing protein [Thiorhodococcus mannitoliphagus]|uniref:DUF4129 domain-containing protein n=1 Tax=Thiorhodococcus mannitoliphagus TaxID=329406 RepID=A0A6P1DQI6_9GAMM|nr:DUF4129 domain-containing protein [Thiorhodococcus mannitoliphagus]NEX19191.1 DUF4129 domain-containing protein [Thiorhodococcus mannitoliphagus]
MMELDRATAPLRQRDAWEGQDLGFALARAWFLPLWLLWWLSVLPVGVACLFLTGFRPDLWLLALWWLKPIYEGPLLIWASRALFGERLGWSDLKTLFRAGVPRRLLPYLLWRRIGMRRSFLMPLTLLEGLQGRAARARRQVMSNGSGVTFWLTLVCYHFEIILWSSLLLGVFFLVPQELPRLDLIAAVTDDASWAYWVSVLAYVFAFSIVAPFYVCAGFALYLSRRTELEAWDLELAFKAARATLAEAARGEAQRPKGGRVGGAATLVLMAGVALLASAGVEADPRSDPDQAKALIAEVLAEPDFGSVKEIDVWVPIESAEDEADPLKLPEGAKPVLLLLASSLKWILLGLAVAGLVLLLVRILRDRRRLGWSLGRARRPTRAPPTESVPMVEARLPADIAQAVRACLRDGDRRGALSLLYRASLAHLQFMGVEVPEGATEGECLRLAARTLSQAQMGPLRQVIRAWQGFAYAHCVPNDAFLESLIDAWAQWAAGGQEPA